MGKIKLVPDIHKNSVLMDLGTFYCEQSICSGSSQGLFFWTQLCLQLRSSSTGLLEQSYLHQHFMAGFQNDLGK